MTNHAATAATKLALLIDGDNISATYLPLIMREAEKHGMIAVRRIYGQFKSGKMKSWMKHVDDFDLTPVNVSPLTKGKNATDMKLVIEAMDMLNGRQLDGICIASSDGDFTPLALRIRASALSVFGFGAKKAPKAYKDEFDRFYECDTLLAAEKAGQKQQQPAERKPAAPAASKPAEPAPTRQAPQGAGQEDRRAGSHGRTGGSAVDQGNEGGNAGRAGDGRNRCGHGRRRPGSHAHGRQQAHARHPRLCRQDLRLSHDHRPGQRAARHRTDQEGQRDLRPLEIAGLARLAHAEVEIVDPASALMKSRCPRPAFSVILTGPRSCPSLTMP